MRLLLRSDAIISFSLEIKNRARNRAGVFCRSSFLSWFVFARTSVLKGLSPTFSQQTGVPLIHLGGIERAPPGLVP